MLCVQKAYLSLTFVIFAAVPQQFLRAIKDADDPSSERVKRLATIMTLRKGPHPGQVAAIAGICADLRLRGRRGRVKLSAGLRARTMICMNSILPSSHSGLEKLPDSWKGVLDTRSCEALQRFAFFLQTVAPK